MAEKRGKHVWSTPKCGISFVDKYLSHIQRDIDYQYIVVRNPYHRIVSFYINKVVHQGNCGENPPIEGVPTYKTSYENEVKIPHYGALNTDITFQEFVRDLSGHNVYHLERHLRPQSHLTDGIQFDKIVKLENFEKDMKEVCEILDIDIDYIMSQKKPNSFPKKNFQETQFFDRPATFFRENGTPNNLNGFYNEELRNIIGRLYSMDFKRFGYPL